MPGVHCSCTSLPISWQFFQSNIFISISLQRKLLWTCCFVLNRPFVETPPIPDFHFGSERKRGIPENFQFFHQFQRFLSNLNIKRQIGSKTLNGHQLDVSQPKQDSSLHSCINHIGHLKKPLFPLILFQNLVFFIADVSRLNDIIFGFIGKKFVLRMSSLPELTFSRNSANSTFSFQIENAESPEMFSFSINLRDFYQTYISDTTSTIETQNRHTSPFSSKRRYPRIRAGKISRFGLESSEDDPACN